MLEIRPLETERLRLEPLTVGDAPALVDVFHHPDMLRYIGGEVGGDVLRGRFERMAAGSGEDDEIWLNWTVRLDGETVGIAQATVFPDRARLAWVIGLPWQRLGYATEATRAVMEWLAVNEVTNLEAHIHPDNEASHRVAARLGLIDTGSLDDAGEMIWVMPPLEEPGAG